MPSYTKQDRRKVVTYSQKHGIQAAADKYGVSTGSVTNWRREAGVAKDRAKTSTTSSPRKGKRTKRTGPRSKRVGTTKAKAARPSPLSKNSEFKEVLGHLRQVLAAADKALERLSS